MSGSNDAAAAALKSQPSLLVKVYLAIYNLVSAALWANIFVHAVAHLLHGLQTGEGGLAGLRASSATLYGRVELMYVAQSLAVMELLHSLTGLVRSAFITAFMQVMSRLLVLWGVVYTFPETRSTLGFTLLTLSWSFVEIPRYLFYAVNTFSSSPYPLLWLRYSLFAVLYPTGITGEILTWLAALPSIERHRPFSLPMPNRFNLPFDSYYLTLFLLALYIPGSYIMYTHMLVLRRKMLSPDASKPKQH